MVGDMHRIAAMIPEEVTDSGLRTSAKATFAPLTHDSTRQFTIHFDGGYNGQCYGSWEVAHNGLRKKVYRQSYSCSVESCNTAEYMAMLGALEFLASVRNKKDYTVVIFTDSTTVAHQMTGVYKCKVAHLLRLRNAARTFLSQFDAWKISWHSRRNNVRMFGH